MNPTNNIGRQDLLGIFLSCSYHFSLGQRYALLINKQMQLNITHVDIGLAIQLDAYQSRFKQSAILFNQNIIGGLIKVFVDANNFCSYPVYLFGTDSQNQVLQAFKDPEIANTLSQNFELLVRVVDTVVANVKLLDTQCQFVATTLSDYDKNYGVTLSNSIKQLNESAQALSKEIDELNKAVAQNIKDIASGITAVGTSITNLATGVLTTISGGLKDPSKDKDKDKPTSRKDIDFAVDVIQLGATGVENATTAIQNLESNNKKLAVAYQALAKQNALVALAKAIEAQNKLFLDILKLGLTNVLTLKTNWEAANEAFISFSKEVKQLKDEDSAKNLSRRLRTAHGEWVGLQEELEKIQDRFINLNGRQNTLRSLKPYTP